MKVQLTDKVSSYQYHGKRYFPSDVFEIDNSAFVSYIMKQIVEPAPIIEEPKLTVEESTVEEIKPKRIRKSVTSDV